MSMTKTKTKMPVTMTNATGTRSKVVLVLLTTFLGFFGLDRMYMGAWLSGFAKLAFFIAGIVMLTTATATLLGVICLVIWGAWCLVDFVLVLINAIERSEANPFSPQTTLKWTNQRDLDLATYVAIGLAVVYMASEVYFAVTTDWGEFLKQS
mmetsp:Transcript_18605/g.32991  ORF Transcript_18605/g.32991 Transcript_18605/m.32991 type:complete len:152 (-) Transcript_18605:759-1214(-)